MSDYPLDPDPPFAPARAVADAPVEALAARGDELARRWAIALLAARPLAELVAVPLEELARHGPALCAASARALRSEQELASLVAAGPDRGRSPGVEALRAICAGCSAASAVARLEALRHVLWEALLEELRAPSTRQLADLADRLAAVNAAMLAATLTERPAPARGEQPPGLRERVLYSSPEPAAGVSGAVLIDERAEPARPAGREPRRAQAGEAGPAGTPANSPRALPWDIPLEGPPPAPPGHGAGEPGATLRVSRGPAARADEHSR